MTTTSDEDDAVELDHGAANTPDTVSYDIGGGPVVSQLDTVALVNGTITFADDTTLTGTFGVIQDTTGALFLTISDSQTTLDDKPVKSLEITSVVTTSFAGASQVSRDDLRFICFAQGTLIATPRGAVAVEMLKAGDLVTTLDNGFQSLRWIGVKRISPDALARYPNMVPVTIEAGALGAGLPRRALKLSGNHRVLASGPVAERMFGTREVLIPARHLVGLPGIVRGGTGAGVVYYHLLCDQHEVLLAEGAQVESLFSGPQALGMLGHGDRLSVLKHVKGIAKTDAEAARLLVDNRRARRFAERCRANGHPIYSVQGFRQMVMS